ncbi:unnamed protein product [Camellia sinensis]
MSKCRDNDDKEGKMMKDSDVHQEEQVSIEGNASSSTPLEENATQIEGSVDKMTEKPSGERNVDLPFHKLTTHDDDDTISQSKSGRFSREFSEPVYRHFLIEFVKRKEATSGTRSGQNDQLGGAENDDDRGDYWGDRTSSGKDAGSSPHCGSPGKGRTRSYWTRNNQPGGQKRAIKALEEFLQATVNDWEAMVLISQLLNSKK